MCIRDRVGDFGRALKQVLDEFAPDRILIEPSGVGKLSDVIFAVENLHDDRICLNGFTTCLLYTSVGIVL